MSDKIQTSNHWKYQSFCGVQAKFPNNVFVWEQKIHNWSKKLRKTRILYFPENNHRSTVFEGSWQGYFAQLLILSFPIWGVLGKLYPAHPKKYTPPDLLQKLSCKCPKIGMFFWFSLPNKNFIGKVSGKPQKDRHLKPLNTQIFSCCLFSFKNLTSPESPCFLRLTEGRWYFPRRSA